MIQIHWRGTLKAERQIEDLPMASFEMSGDEVAPGSESLLATRMDICPLPPDGVCNAEDIAQKN